ncbi:MAG: hypothetical protein QME94_07740 [Anaerolineae bacterium]|nr:hypothetical protein [Anaerolineae bacterium]
MEKRFRSLRIIATVFKVLAWIVLVAGIIGGLIMMITGLAGGMLGASSAARDTTSGLGAASMMAGLLTGFAGGLVTVIGSVLYFLLLYAAGDAITLALAIEQNTRETAHYLKGGDTYPRAV